MTVGAATRQRPPWLAMGVLLAVGSGCPTPTRVPFRAPCERVSVGADEATLARLFEQAHHTLLIVRDEVFVCGCPGRSLGGARESRRVAGAQEQRNIAGVQEQRNIAGAQEQRNVAGAQEQRNVAGAQEQRNVAGAQEQRNLAGAQEQRTLAGAQEQRTLAGAQEQRNLAGAQEERRGGGAQERRDFGGSSSAVMCHERPECSGWAVTLRATATYDARGLVPIDGDCVEL